VTERTSTFEYYPDDAPFGAGELKKITGPLSSAGAATVEYTYDGYGRVHTTTDQEGYTTTLQ
jgi:YD repeat-containing protein